MKFVRRNTRGLYWVLIAVIFVVFLAKGALFIDPDFGWRVSTGEIILTQGIPATDPFTYSMPSFPFVDHAWLVSTAIALLFPVAGLFGLSTVFSLLAVSSVLIAGFRADKNVYKNKPFIVIPLVLAFAVLISFFGVRAQILTWFLYSVLLFVMLKNDYWKKYRLLIPILFLIWANFHGGFVAGLVCLALVIIVKGISTRKLLIVDLFVLATSFFFTLINPYGLGLWREVWMTTSDTSLAWTILEWMPSIFRFHLSAIAFGVLTVFFVLRYRSEFSFEEKVLFVALFLAAILTRRQFPLWVLVALPMLISCLWYFYEEISKVSGARKRLIKVYKWSLLGSLAIFILQTFFALSAAAYFKPGSFYPESAVNYLKANLAEGQIFSEYGWGGYLIWKLPEKKVFIDGRMPSWRWSEGKAGESNYVMKDYLNAINGKVDYKLTFFKYDIDTVLWPAAASEGFYKKIEKAFLDLLQRHKGREEQFDLLLQLSNDGWEKVYEDTVAVIYSKGQ